MDFVTWWFAQHWLMAVIFTPGLAFLYNYWAGNIALVVASMAWTFFGLTVRIGAARK